MTRQSHSNTSQHVWSSTPTPCSPPPQHDKTHKTTHGESEKGSPTARSGGRRRAGLSILSTVTAPLVSKALCFHLTLHADGWEHAKGNTTKVVSSCVSAQPSVGGLDSLGRVEWDIQDSTEIFVGNSFSLFPLNFAPAQERWQLFSSNCWLQAHRAGLVPYNRTSTTICGMTKCM